MNKSILNLMEAEDKITMLENLIANMINEGMVHWALCHDEHRLRKQEVLEKSATDIAKEVKARDLARCGYEVLTKQCSMCLYLNNYYYCEKIDYTVPKNGTCKYFEEKQE